MDKGLHILILEDNPNDAELMEYELKAAGFTFTSKRVVAKDAFVQAIEEFSPDVILSDYDLPQYNGGLALEEARKRCPDIPFILISGVVNEDRAIEILTSGARDYIVKSRLNRLAPAVKRALADAEEHIARKKAEEELHKAKIDLERLVRERTNQLQMELADRQKAEEALRKSERVFASFQIPLDYCWAPMMHKLSLKIYVEMLWRIWIAMYFSTSWWMNKLEDFTLIPVPASRM